MSAWPHPAPRLAPPSLAGGIDAGCASPSCYEIADDHCVAEVLGTRTEDDFSLALHVVVDGESDATVAWWQLDDAIWAAEPGVA
jgi:hypothetical protein